MNAQSESRHRFLALGLGWLCSGLPVRSLAQTSAAGSDVASFSMLWAPLLIVVALGLVAWWLVRSRGSLLQRGGPVQLVQIVPLGPRERLLLVELDGERLLIGSTANQITLLSRNRLPSPADSEASDPP